MKKENGVTLTSIIIYILALLIVIGVISALTSYFYRNIDLEGESKITNSQFTKFSSYFTEEINQEGIEVLEAGENENVSYIAFSNNTTYTYSKQNHCIYVNEIKICTNIDNCTFNYEENGGKYKITVNFKSKKKKKETVFNTK